MLEEFIQDYARDNIWCAPFQDNPAILKLSRITVPNGVSKKSDIYWDSVTLPDSTSAWTLYAVGANVADRLNFPAIRMKWIPLNYWGEKNKTDFKFYFLDGRRLPTYHAYVLLTPDKGYIVAMRMDDKYFPIKSTDLYLHIYRNRFWESTRSDGLLYTIEYGGERAMNNRLITEMQNDVAFLRKQPGIVNCYINGKWVDDVDPKRIAIGDYVEYVHDGSVSRIVDFKVDGLRDFFSELDKVKKYLLHPAKEDISNGIRYRDDVEVILYKKLPGGGLEGRYYNRNREDSLRMLTHADYSIPVDNILTYFQGNEWTTRDNLYIRLHIRESGYHRPLVHQHTRIRELYKMTDTEIAKAMLGIQATLPEWYAPNLESSYYTAVMRKWWPPFEYQKLLEMLGYDAIGELVAPSPRRVQTDAGIRYISLGGLEQAGATIYEYNKEGIYLDRAYHSMGERYVPKSANCDFCEIYLGEGGRVLDYTAGNADVQLATGRMYRFYKTPKVNNVPTGEYQLAENLKDYVVDDNNVLKWVYAKSQWEGVVWSDKQFLINEVSWLSPSGVFDLTVTHGAQLGNALPIQPERIILIVNGFSATEGVDYHVKWPVIHFVRKDLIDPKGVNKFIITCQGMSANGEHRVSSDVGFIFQGVASINDRYDIREGRVMRTVVDGRVKFTDEVYFAEDYPATGKPLAPNGAVYECSPVYVPLRDLTYQQLDALRVANADIVERLEDFLTLRHPQHTFTGPSPILKKHQVYSPMLTQMLYDIEMGTLVVPSTPESAADLERSVRPYLPNLDIEPSVVGYNTNYVVVVPHPYDNIIEITELQWRFFQAVIHTYLKNDIKLNNHFIIKES